ncbi:MAG: hypothetical protein WCD79_13390 [Chthoniobacteraceae bacterium]
MKNIVKSLMTATAPASLIAAIVPAFAATVHSTDLTTSASGIGTRSDPAAQSPSPKPSATPTPTPSPSPTPTPARTPPDYFENIAGLRR